jgi:hypothetical protein
LRWNWSVHLLIGIPEHQKASLIVSRYDHRRLLAFQTQLRRASSHQTLLTLQLSSLYTALDKPANDYSSSLLAQSGCSILGFSNISEISGRIRFFGKLQLLYNFMVRA